MFLLHCSKAPPGVLKDVHLLQGQSSLAVDSLVEMLEVGDRNEK
jgi:hypothetical protein